MLGSPGPPPPDHRLLPQQHVWQEQKRQDQPKTGQVSSNLH